MGDPFIYKDRRTGLVVFGILEILAGASFCLLVPFMVLAQFVQAHQTGTAVNFENVSVMAVFYGAVAVIFVCLGIGSIKARRWARALSLIFSWLSLVIGVLSTIMLGWLLPHMLESAPGFSDEKQKGVLIVVLCMVFGIMFLMVIVMPLVGVLFYGSRHVKATCEAKSPAAWTDACPLPVLASCVYAGINGTSVLWMFISRVLFAAETSTLFEIALLVVFLIFGTLALFSAWRMYRLSISGWWLQIIVVVIGSVMGVMNMIHLKQFWELQAASPFQLPFAVLFGLVLVPNVLWLGYLLWIRKFFNRKGPIKAPELPTAQAT